MKFITYWKESFLLWRHLTEAMVLAVVFGWKLERPS